MNHPPLRAPGLRRGWLALGLSGLLTLAAPGARADIVTLGANPLPLANCPWGAIGLPGACLVQTAAQVRDTVSDFSQVRIGRGGQGSLSIGSGASLLVNITGMKLLDLFVGLPFWAKHSFDGEHHWELGKRGTSLGTVRRAIEGSGLRIVKGFRPAPSRYAYFFVLA